MLLGEDMRKNTDADSVECQEREVEKVKKDTGLVFEPFFFFLLFFPSINSTQGSALGAFFGGTIYASGVANPKSWTSKIQYSSTNSRERH